MKPDLQLYTIMRLDMEHIDEICADIREQFEKGVATCALFMMTLVPEGNPPVDKAREMCEQYRQFREKLSGMGIPNGVLVQASIGHGWVLSEKFPFQCLVNLTDGTEREIVCPYDEGFREYMYRAMKTIAECRPDHIMLDDDFRLLFRPGGGCACPLHRKRFAQLAGVEFTREELLNAVLLDTDEGREYNRIFVETQRESLIDAAKIMRRGIDAVDPKLPGSFCCVGNNAEFGAEIAQIMAGEGNPVVVRINNGNYTAAGARFFSKVFFRAAAQIEKLRDKVDIILAETDTCPQNRYSTSAQFLHTHFTGSILEGANGAKHWITRLAAYEPASGKAYRKILSKYRGFYAQLSQWVPQLRWRGCRIPLLGEAHLQAGRSFYNEQDNAWCTCVLERMGLPVYFSSKPGGVLCLEGDADSKLTDEQLLEALKGPVLLASDSAQSLIRRGFGKYLGVDVREWTGLQASNEVLKVNGNPTKYQMHIKELVPNQPGVEEDSVVYHAVGKKKRERLFPGAAVFENELGGIVFTFCGSPRTQYGIVEAFSFLNESRKAQLVAMLSRTGELPVYYPNDEEVYLRAAGMEDGSLFAAVFNLGMDPIEEMELVVRREFSEVWRLLPDGSQESVPFRREADRVFLPIVCAPVDPLILRLK